MDKREEGDPGVPRQRGTQQGVHADHCQVDTQNWYELYIYFFIHAHHCQVDTQNRFEFIYIFFYSCSPLPGGYTEPVCVLGCKRFDLFFVLMERCLD